MSSVQQAVAQAHPQETFANELASSGTTPAASATSVQAGLQVLEEFLAAFNARDRQRWAATLNYPHIRLAAGKTQVWNSAEEYAASNDIAGFADTGWDHTRWDWIKPVQAGEDKAHFALQFTRYTKEGKPIVSYPSFYVVTLQDGHWGVQLRSSYAGIVQPNSAF